VTGYCLPKKIKSKKRKLLRNFAPLSATTRLWLATRQHLRSASRGLLVVPRHHLSSYGRRDFSVAGPTIWNWLPDSLRDPAVSRDSFKRSLKTFLFSAYSCI